MGRKTYEYRDFSGGDYGRLEAWRAPKNSFSALNMLVYRTGELGVRPGVRNVSPSGLASGAVLGISRSSKTDGVAFVQGDRLRSFVPRRNNTLVTYTNLFTATPDIAGLHYLDGNTLYITARLAGVYSANVNSSVLTQLNASPDGNLIAKYGDRIVVGNLFSNNSALRYNGTTAGVSDLTVWPAGNIIPIGEPGGLVNGIWAQRSHLLIAKDEGLFVLTGVPGVNESVRQTSSHGRGQIEDVDVNGTGWGVERSTPISYNGASFRPFPDQLIPPRLMGTAAFYEEAPGVLYLGSSPSGASVGPSPALLYHHGVWTKHSFNIRAFRTVAQAAVALTGTVVADPGVNTADSTALLATQRDVNMFVLTDTAVAAVPKFYSWVPGLDRPGAEMTDALLDPYNSERAGDDSSSQVTGSVTFPEQRSDDGSDIQVQGVRVDFRKWNTGGALTNHFDLAVSTLHSYETPGTVSSVTASWDEAGSLASTSGTLQSRYFGFGDQGRGVGFQLSMTNIRGIAIQRIQVIAESYPSRGL